MVVNIEKIREEGLELDEPIEAKFLENALGQEGQGIGFRPLRGFRLRASLRKVGPGVLLEASFRANLLAPCKRCLEDVIASLPVSFILNFLPQDQVQEAADSLEDDEQSQTAGSFDLEDADQEWFNGKTIDLDPILREQILLALPMSVLCAESCRGLCPVCGQNLNLKDCRCERKVADPRWMALKDIKLS
jgi:uncharacterized protein